MATSVCAAQQASLAGSLATAGCRQDASLVGGAYLGFSRSVSSSLALIPVPAQRRRGGAVQVVAETQRGTQLFKWVGGVGRGNKGRGTIILRGGKKEGTQRQKGTRKITTSTKPEEVGAAKEGLFEGLLKPFASLFGGRQTDPKTVFVAGPAGATGSRIVLQLLAEGFTVRAGVDEAESASRLAELAAEFRQLVSAEDAKRLNFVQCDTSDPEFTAKAIANAGKVVVTLGAEENGPKTSVAPIQALGLLQAAQQAKVPCFVLVTDFAEPGGNSGGLLGAVFGFFASLGKPGISYMELLREIVDSSVKFTVIRKGKSDGVPDSTAASTSIVLGPEGKFSTGTISRAQVASVVAEVLANPDVSENKVVDVIAQAGVEAVPVAELLQAVPTDGRRTAKEAARAKAEAESKEREFREAAEAEARAVAAEAKAAAESLAALEAEAKKVAAQEAKAAAAEVKALSRAEAASASVSDLTRTLREVSSSAAAKAGGGKSVLPSFASLVPDIPPPTPSSVAAAAQAAAAAAAASLGGGSESGTVKQRRALKQRAEKKPAAAPAPVKAPPPSQKPKKEKRFGLFEQETIYMDPEDGF